MIPLTRPNLGEEEVIAVKEVLLSGQLVQAEKTNAFEQIIADYLGCRNAIAVSSGTAALHLSLIALGIGRNDEVIVPAFTFPATANVVELVGAKPIFVDVDSEMLNIQIDKIEAKITPNTKAIIPVHEFGCPVKLDVLVELCSCRGIKLIEDAACAFGAEFNSVKCGTIGDVGCFSLHPRKAITTGEGGIIVTNSDDLASFIRKLRNHGQTRLDDKVEFEFAGFNYRITEIQSAIGIVQMKKLERMIVKRIKLAKLYDDLLADSNIKIPHNPEFGKHIYQTYHVILPNSIDRDMVIEKMLQLGIGTNLGAYSLNLLKSLKKYADEPSYPNSERAYKSGLALPLFHELKEAEVGYIVEMLKSVCNE